MKSILAIFICLTCLQLSSAQNNSIKSKLSSPTPIELEKGTYLLPMVIKYNYEGKNLNSLNDFKNMQEEILGNSSMSEELKIAFQKESELLRKIYSASSFEDIIYLLNNKVQLHSHSADSQGKETVHYFVFSIQS